MKLLGLLLALLGAPTSLDAAEGDAKNKGFASPDPTVSIYQGASGTLTATSTPVAYQAATFDNMAGSYSGGIFQCGPGGVFSVSASLAVTATIALGNTLALEILVSGVSKRKVSQGLPALISKASTSVSNIVYCPANGTISVNASSSALNPVITSDPSENTFTILKLFIDK